jgi:ubiquitin carboxyl-terminal hydrolase L3
MNEFAHNLGLSANWAYTDVYGLEPDLLSFLPQPVIALLLLFPITGNYERHRKQEAEVINRKEQEISANIFFLRQTISNACGTIGLLHSLANNEYTLEEGPVKHFIEKARDLDPVERAKLLEQDSELAMASETCARSGQTATPRLEDNVDLHFICLVQKDGHLYELDGRKPLPINHGKCKDFLTDGVRVIKQFMERDPENLRFTVIALAPSQE